MAATKGIGRLATGRFVSRTDLTCHVWAMRRQQVVPNIHAIALACGITVGVVKKILDAREGLEDYLERGCLIGG
jgi:hypothetical protein